MPWPLLSTTDNSSNSIQSSVETRANEEEDNEEYHWHELTITEHDSLFTSLNRIYLYWREILFEKFRFILTLVFVTMLNMATRLMYFTGQRGAVRSTSPSIRTFEEDINPSSTSFRNFNSRIDLPSIETPPMTHILVRQQTPNINIHQTTSTQNHTHLPISHSLDENLFYYKSDSTCFLEFLQRFASEPQISKFSSTSDEFLNQNFPLSNTFLPVNNSEDQEEEINSFNCDKIEPVIIDGIKSNEFDNISVAITIDELDEDIILNTNSSLNTERHFRRRKRRSSLTHTPSIYDKREGIITDAIEKIDDNNNSEKENDENVQPMLIDNLSLEKTKPELNDQTTPPDQFRRRKLRYRSQRQTSQQPISDDTLEVFLPTETLIPTPPRSPTLPSENISLSSTNPNVLTNKLKRTGSNGTTKKMVRFADSVGRELAQVQYIQPLTDDDDSKDYSFVKNNLYLPKTLNFEHKPWSFDVALPSKQHCDTPIPKRFFYLYRQPSSEHPDIYLHEIWKSQIKLEYTDIRLKSSLTGEQYLYGTLWVTNASYWKKVTIKYTFNRWLNTYEYEAKHQCHSNDFRNIDQFEFSIDIPSDVDRIDFVLRYYVNGQEYWDNNGGKNYTLETESASIPSTTISLPHDCDFNEMRFY